MMCYFVQMKKKLTPDIPNVHWDFLILINQVFSKHTACALIIYNINKSFDNPFFSSTTRNSAKVAEKIIEKK